MGTPTRVVLPCDSAPGPPSRPGRGGGVRPAPGPRGLALGRVGGAGPEGCESRRLRPGSGGGAGRGRSADPLTGRPVPVARVAAGEQHRPPASREGLYFESAGGNSEGFAAEQPVRRKPRGACRCREAGRCLGPGVRAGEENSSSKRGWGRRSI